MNVDGLTHMCNDISYAQLTDVQCFKFSTLILLYVGFQMVFSLIPFSFHCFWCRKRGSFQIKQWKYKIRLPAYERMRIKEKSRESPLLYTLESCTQHDLYRSVYGIGLIIYWWKYLNILKICYFCLPSKCKCRYKIMLLCQLYSWIMDI